MAPAHPRSCAFLADCGGEILDADRSAGEFVEYGAQELAVHHVESQASTSSIASARSAASRVIAPSARTGEVAHAPQQPVDDARRAARTLRDLQRTLRISSI
jgi:hypothetical protein